MREPRQKQQQVLRFAKDDKADLISCCWWGGFGWGEGSFGYGCFYFGVDLGSEEDHEAGEIEPGEEDDDGAEGSVGEGVGVEEVKVDAEAEGGEEPA